MIDLLCTLPLISGLMSGCTPAPLATGYVEGEYVLVAPLASAQIDEIAVTRGSRVAAGDRLVRMESRDAEIALSGAEAALARAQSTLTNLLTGRRDEEIAVLEAAQAQARARAQDAETELTRQTGLRERKVASQAQLDAAHTAYDVAQAQLAAAEADLTVARLPARPEEIAAARAAVTEAEAARDAARWQLDQRVLTADAPGIVNDIIRRKGEISGPSAPVLSYLPDGAVKLRLYLPQADLSRVDAGTKLAVHCDGCPALTATVTYIADGPEFTPPVIYSEQTRQKLVYLIEAHPDAPDGLKPGQIVNVGLAP